MFGGAGDVGLAHVGQVGEQGLGVGQHGREVTIRDALFLAESLHHWSDLGGEGEKTFLI